MSHVVVYTLGSGVKSDVDLRQITELIQVVSKQEVEMWFEQTWLYVYLRTK